MASTSKTTLQGHFDTGDRPTASNFTDLVHSSFNHVSDHHAIVAAATHTNTITAADMGTTTIPANTLMAGSVIKLTSAGHVVDQNGSDTLTPLLNLTHGSTTVALATGAALAVADNDEVLIESTIQFYTVGATGTFVAVTKINTDAAGAVTLVNTVTSTAVDTTAAITITANFDWSAAHADNEYQHLIHTAQVFGVNA